jgi:hypothetical protein
MKKRVLVFFTSMLTLFCTVHADVHLILQSFQAHQGSMVTVPVRVKDFENIISMQGTIEFDPQVISFVNVQAYGLPGMNASNFGTSQTQNGKLMFSWFENNLTGQFLPDSAVLFTMVFHVTGSIGQQSMLSFVNNPTSLEVINAAFQQQQLNLFNGVVEIQQAPVVYDMAIFCDTMTVIPGSSILVPVRAVDFNRIVSAQGTIEFDPAVVNFTSVTNFGLPGMNASNFGLTQIQSGVLTYSWHDPSNQGINLSDSAVLFMMNFFVAGNSGQSTLILFTSLPVPLEVADTSLLPLTVLYNNGLVHIQQNVQWDFPVFMLDTVSGPQGAQVTAYARAVNFSQIVSLQGTVHFDENIASFINVGNFGLPGMSINDFGQSLTNQGKLMFSWSDPLLSGVNLPDTALLFSLTFLINGVQGDESPLDFLSTPTPLECTDTSFAPVMSSFVNGRILVEGDAQIMIHDPNTLFYFTGDSIHVSYATSGNFVTGNMFILTLSDAMGNFSSPWLLDTLYTILDSTFHTVIPQGVPSGSGYRLRIISSNPVAVSNMNDFDISILEMPTCIQPSNLMATSITTNGAVLGWTQSGNVSSWEVEYGNFGFTQGNGTMITPATNPQSVTGINSGTAYDFYVRAVCGSSDFSPWAGPFTFITECVEPFILPYYEDFENLVACWSVQDFDGGGESWEPFTINHTTGGSYSFGHTFGSSGYYEEGLLVSPEIILPAGIFLELSFWSFNTGTTAYGSNSVLISTDNWQTSDIIWNPVSVNELIWEKMILNISAFAGQTIRLGFGYEGTEAHNWFIDDIEISEIITSQKTLDVTVFTEGLYIGGGQMRKAQDVDPITWMYVDKFGGDTADVVTLELWTNTGTMVFSDLVGLSTTGNINADIDPSYNGDYYIYIRHRNSIAISSANPVSFAGSTITYNFTTAAAQAYFDNQKNLGGGIFGLFAGDVLPDGSVGAFDMILVDNASKNFLEGYYPEDVNGDAEVGAFDLIFVDNNSRDFVFEYLPF